MFSRLSQVARHLSKPLLLSTIAQKSSPYIQQPVFKNTIMASGATAAERDSKTIHTAACLIIGDEVLGGKAGATWIRY
jgi:hypothetical protein